MRVEGAVDGVDAQRLIDADPLVSAPSLPVPPSARHHPLYSHTRIKRPRAEVRARSSRDTGVEKASKCHAALHEIFAVEMKLIGVVVRVGCKDGGYHAGGLDPSQQVIVNQGAMRDFRARVVSWE